MHAEQVEMGVSCPFFNVVGLSTYFETEIESDEKRKRDGLQNPLFVQRVLDLLQLHHLFVTMATTNHVANSTQKTKFNAEETNNN